MTSNQTIELRRIARQLAEVAERLDGETIGTKQITKRDAATALNELRTRLLALAEPVQMIETN